MMWSIIAALVALVIGAAGMYFYQQGAVSELRNAAAALQTQAAQSKAAADAATAEVVKLQEARQSPRGEGQDGGHAAGEGDRT